MGSNQSSPCPSPYLKELWRNDCDVKNCTHCSVKFTKRIRKHHCRGCGQIFCEKCIHKKEILLPPKFEFRNKQKVCAACFAFFEEGSPLYRLQFPRHVRVRRVNAGNQCDSVPMLYTFQIGKWRPLNSETCLSFSENQLTREQIQIVESTIKLHDQPPSSTYLPTSGGPSSDGGGTVGAKTPSSRQRQQQQGAQQPHSLHGEAQEESKCWSVNWFSFGIPSLHFRLEDDDNYIRIDTTDGEFLEIQAAAAPSTAEEMLNSRHFAISNEATDDLYRELTALHQLIQTRSEHSDSFKKGRNKFTNNTAGDHGGADDDTRSRDSKSPPGPDTSNHSTREQVGSSFHRKSDLPFLYQGETVVENDDDDELKEAATVIADLKAQLAMKDEKIEELERKLQQSYSDNATLNSTVQNLEGRLQQGLNQVGQVNNYTYEVGVNLSQQIQVIQDLLIKGRVPPRNNSSSAASTLPKVASSAEISSENDGELVWTCRELKIPIEMRVILEVETLAHLRRGAATNSSSTTNGGYLQSNNSYEEMFTRFLFQKMCQQEDLVNTPHDFAEKIRAFLSRDDVLHLNLEVADSQNPTYRGKQSRLKIATVRFDEPDQSEEARMVTCFASFDILVRTDQTTKPPINSGGEQQEEEGDTPPAEHRRHQLVLGWIPKAPSRGSCFDPFPPDVGSSNDS